TLEHERQEAHDRRSKYDAASGLGLPDQIQKLDALVLEGRAGSLNGLFADLPEFDEKAALRRPVPDVLDFNVERVDEIVRHRLRNDDETVDGPLGEPPRLVRVDPLESELAGD